MRGERQRSKRRSISGSRGEVRRRSFERISGTRQPFDSIVVNQLQARFILDLRISFRHNLRMNTARNHLLNRFPISYFASTQASAHSDDDDSAPEIAPGDAGTLLKGCTMRMGGRVIFENGQFQLSGEVEQLLVQHM